MIADRPELNLNNYDESDVASLEGWAIEAEGEIERLQAFKDYVHAKLDIAGVPESPCPEKTAETGCRIGPRLDWLLANGSTGGKPEAAASLDLVITKLDEWIINSADRLSWLERNDRYQDAAFERVIHDSYRQTQLLVERAKQPA